MDNWQGDLYAKNIYLERRDPIHPFVTFYGGHLVTESVYSQADRAALLTAVAFNFKQRLERGQIEQDYVNEEPSCMSSMQWLFNACREPAVGVDKIRKYPGNNYIMALRHGHIFKINMEVDGEMPSLLRLKAAFSAIIIHSEDIPSIATLTADDRDSWAEVCLMIIAVTQR